MSEALDILEGYLHRMGLSRPRDAAQQYQVTLLRQWTEHLGEVLKAEQLPPEMRTRITRAVIYCGVPNVAEGEIRLVMQRDMRDILMRAAAAHPGTQVPPA